MCPLELHIIMNGKSLENESNNMQMKICYFKTFETSPDEPIKRASK